MKTTFLKISFISAIAVILTNACKEQKVEECHFSTSSYELDNKDTINLIDNHGFKQGKWEVKDRSHEPPVFIESGNYKNNLKQGVWHYYDSAGNINRSVNYLNDMPIKN